MKRCLSDVVRWSDSEYSLQQFVECCSKRFPVIIRTTSGFAGGDGALNEVGADELYWVFDIERQKRVVAKNEDGLCVSLLPDAKKSFVKLPSNSEQRYVDSEPTSLERLVAGGVPRGERVLHTVFASISLDIRDKPKDTKASLGPLQLIDSYEEKYLLAHSLFDDEIHSTVVAIPVYLPIAVRFAVGFLCGDANSFKLWTRELARLAGGFERRKLNLSKGILVFDELPSADNPDDYAFLRRSRLLDVDTSFPVQSTTSAPLSVSRRITRERSSSVGTNLDRNNNNNSDSSSNVVAANADDDHYEKILDDDAQPVDTTSPSTPPADRCRQQPTNRSRSPGRPLPARPPRSAPDPPSIPGGIRNLHQRPAADTRVARRGARSRSVPRQHPQPLALLTVGSASRDDATPRSPRGVVVSSAWSPPVRRSSPTYPRSSPTRRAAAVQADRYTAEPRSAGSNRSRVTPTGPPRAGPAAGRRLAVSCSSVPSSPPPPLIAFQKSSWTSWRRPRDVPCDVDVAQFSVDQIAHCVEVLGLPSTVAEQFRRRDVDGRLLVDALSEDVLVGEFGLRRFDAKKLLMFARDGWRPKTT